MQARPIASCNEFPHPIFIPACDRRVSIRYMRVIALRACEIYTESWLDNANIVMKSLMLAADSHPLNSGVNSTLSLRFIHAKITAILVKEW